MKLRIVPCILSTALFTVSVSAVCLAQQKPDEVTVKREIRTVRLGAVMPTVGFSITNSVGPTTHGQPTNDPVDIALAPSLTGPGISEIEVENISGKEISSIKFKWSLFRGETPGALLKHGETRQVKTKGFLASQKKIVDCPVPEFDDLFRDLATDGFVRGPYSLQVTLSELTYADGTKWKRSEDAEKEKVKAQED